MLRHLLWPSRLRYAIVIVLSCKFVTTYNLGDTAVLFCLYRSKIVLSHFQDNYCIWVKSILHLKIDFNF